MTNTTITSDRKQQLACLYTKNKTQKRKVWQDGRLVVNTKSLKAILHDANPPHGSGDPSLGECEITASEAQKILQTYNAIHKDQTECLHETTLETERYLIEIEGPWTNVSSSILSKRSLNNGKKIISTSMKKLLTSKYKRPKPYIPPPPSLQTNRVDLFGGGRRRPLQPGELMAKYYGTAGFSADPTRGAIDDKSRNTSNSQIQLRCDLQWDNRRENFRVIDDENTNTSPTSLSLERNRFQQKDQQQAISRQQPLVRPQVSHQPPDMSNALTRPKDCRDIGSAPFRPQSRNTHSYRYRHTKHQPICDAGSFVQNEFDPENFYGVDGENKFGAVKDSLMPPSQESLVQTLPRLSDVQTFVDERKREKQSENMDMKVNYNVYNDRKNGRGNIAFDRDAFQPKSGINHQEEKRFQNQRYQRSKKPNGKCSHYISCQTPVFSMTVKQHRENKDDSESRNHININQSIPRVDLELQPKHNDLNSNCIDRDRHLLKILDYENKESESEDGISIDGDDDDDVPSTFNPKSIESFVDPYKKSKDMKSNLLALFGADASEQSYNKDSNPELTENTEPKAVNIIIIDNNNKNSTLRGFAEIEDEQPKLKSIMSGKIYRKRDQFDDSMKDYNTVEIEKVGKGKQEDQNCCAGGFYLASASTSSEESSDRNSHND